MLVLRSVAAVVSLLGLLVLSCSSSAPEEHESVGVAAQGLTRSEAVLGFETLENGAWTAISSNTPIALSDEHTEGEHSLSVAVGTSQYFKVKSAKISGPDSATDRLWVDVWLPAGEYTWRGGMNATLDAPSCGAYSVVLGYATFSYFVEHYGADRFVRIGYPLTAYQQWVLNCAKTDLTVTFDGSVPAGMNLLLDRVYVGQPTETVDMPSTASVEIDLPVGLEMSDVAAHANGSLRVNDRAKVYAYLARGYAPISNVGGVSTTLGVESEVGTVYSVPDVVLRSRAKVNGSLFTGGEIEPQDTTSIVSGVSQSGVSFVPLNKVKWSVTIPSEAEPGFLLEPGTQKTSAIAPGHYGPTNLKNDTKLVVGAGTYYFDQLYIDKGSKFDIDNRVGPTVIYVLDSLILRGEVTRRITVPNVMFVYLGSMAASIDTSLPATFVASQADAILEPSRVVNGAVFGQNVELHQGSTTNHEAFIRSDCASLASSCEATPGCPSPDADRDGLTDCDERSDEVFWTDEAIFNGTRQRLYPPCHTSGLSNELIDTAAEVSACTSGDPLETKNQYSGWNWAIPSSASSCDTQFGFSDTWSPCRNDWMVYSEGYLRVETSSHFCFALEGGTTNSAAALFVEAQSGVAKLDGAVQCFTLSAGIHRVSWLYERVGATPQPFAIVYCSDTVRDCVPSRPLTQREVRVAYSAGDAVCDSAAACSELCACASGGICSGDSQCQPGLVCGTTNGANFGLGSNASVCWPSICATDSSGSQCSVTIVECSTTDDCESGEVCGAANSDNFAYVYDKVCWLAACETDPVGTGCGSALSPCGLCECTPDCSNKACGFELDNGCGGVCQHYCEDGGTGCISSLECQDGSVCVAGGAAYWGGSATESACMPSSCMETPAEDRACGTATSACGSVCETCVSACTGRECGPDPKCGGSCGACSSGTFCNSSGLCEANSTNPVLQVTPKNILEPSEAGTIEGTFSVTPTGQAHYSIPLIVPPGVNGLAPQLSLEYDSSFGHGPMGLGWKLGGASSITRCPRTYAQGGAAPLSFKDHYDVSEDDQFCLDGVPLVLVDEQSDGKREYRTEFESFVRVWSIPDTNFFRSRPVRFEVESLDGSVRTYGGSEGAYGLIASPERLIPWGSHTYSTRTSWELSRVGDRFGNYVSFVYNQTPDFVGTIADPTGDLADAPNFPGNFPYPNFYAVTYHPLLTEINYGGNADFSGNRKIKLETESLKEIGLGSLIRNYWNSGIPRVDFLRYTRITTYFEEKEVRNYRLGYADDGQVMQLSTVQECHGDACKPSTTMEYGDVPAFNAVTPTDITTLMNSAGMIGGNRFSVRTVQLQLDANGDGITDLLLNPVIDSRNDFDCSQYVTLALGTGDRSFPYKFVKQTQIGVCSQIRGSDLDGDGRTEIVQLKNVEDGPRIFDNKVATYIGEASVFKYLDNGTFSGYEDYPTDVGTSLFGDYYDSDGDGLPVQSYQGRRNNYLYDTDSDGVVEAVPPASVVEPPNDGYESLIEAAEQDEYARKVKAESTDCDEYLCCHTMPVKTKCPNGLSCEEASNAHTTCTQYLAYTAAEWLRGGVKALDSNGDGLQDFVKWYANPVGLFKILENTGQDRHVTDFASALYPSKSGRAFRQSFVYDTDRDGRDEMVFASEDGTFTRVSVRGVSLHAKDPDKTSVLGQMDVATRPRVGVRDQFLVMDVDGDRVPDVLLGDEKWRVLYQNGNVSRRLGKITNGLGRVDGIAYAQGKAVPYTETLTQEDSPNTTPMKVIPPVVIGHGVMVTVGAGSTYVQSSESYSYADARMGRYGRGFLGYGTVTREVSADGMLQYTESTNYDVTHYLPSVGFASGPGGKLLHTYPFAGTPLLRRRTYVNVPIGIGGGQDTGTVVETDEWKYTLESGNGFRPRRYLKELWSTRREESLNNKGRTLSSSVTTYDVDDYGAEAGMIRIVWSGNGTEVERTDVTRKYEFTALDGGLWAHRLPTKITTVSSTGGESSSIVEHLEYYDSGAVRERHLGREASSLSKLTQFTYNDRGNVLTQSDSSGTSSRHNSVTYDARGEYPETRTNAAGHSFTEAYHKGYGVSAVHEDINGLISQTGIDGFGRIVSTVDAQGNELTLDYQRIDAGNGPNFLEGRARLVENRVQLGSPRLKNYYDSLGRLIGTEEIFADGKVKRAAAGFYGTGLKAWNTARPFVGTSLPVKVATYQYDSTGRLLSTAWPNDYASDAVSSVTNSFDSPENWPNDEVGDETIAGASVMVRREYPDGLVETELLDLAGRRLAKLDAAGATTVLRYGPMGRLREIRDAAGLTFETQWDALGRVVGTKDPIRGNGTVTYSSGLSEVVVTTSNAGTVTRRNDVLGRGYSEDRPEGKSTWVYDDGPHAVGQIVRVTGPASTLSPDGTVISYTYGPTTGTRGTRGKVRSVTRTITGEDFVLGFDYDTLGRLSEMDYPSAAGSPFKVKTDYDEDGELKLVSDGVATNSGDEYWRLIKRTTNREVETERLANAIDSTYTYSPWLGKTQSVTHSWAGTELGKGVYSYNESGNVTTVGQWEDGVVSENSRIYEYDDAGRLRNAYVAALSGSVWSKGARALGVQFDTVGNIVQKSDVGTFEYNTIGNPYAVSAAGGNTYRYDLLGRQFWRSGPGIKGQLQTIDYASFGQPTTITTGQDDIVQFGYDALHELTISDDGTKRTVHVAGLYQRTGDSNEPGQFTHVYTVRAAGRTVAEVVAHEQAGSLVGENKIRTIIPDHLGGPAMSVGAGGDVRRSHYDEFGRALDTLVSETGTGYAGYQTTLDTGLIRMGVRMYDPILGRVLSPDGIMIFAMGQDGLNPYAYAYNRPTRYVDPSGFDAENVQFPFAADSGQLTMSLTVEAEAVVDLMGGNDAWSGVAIDDGPMLYSDYADGAYQTAEGQMSLASGQQVSGGVATSDVAVSNTSATTDTTLYGTGSTAPNVPVCTPTGCWAYGQAPETPFISVTVDVLSVNFDPGFGERGVGGTAVNLSKDGAYLGTSETSRFVPDVGVDLLSVTLYPGQFYSPSLLKSGTTYGIDILNYGVNTTIVDGFPASLGFKFGIDINVLPIDFTVTNTSYFPYYFQW